MSDVLNDTTIATGNDSPNSQTVKKYWAEMEAKKKPDLRDIPDIQPSNSSHSYHEPGVHTIVHPCGCWQKMDCHHVCNYSRDDIFTSIREIPKMVGVL